MATGFSAAMRETGRQLTLRGTVCYQTGTSYDLGPEDFISVKISEGAENGLLPGSVLSAGCRIEVPGELWRPGGANRGYAPMENALLTLELGVRNGQAYLYAPLGVYVCEDIEVGESGTAVITAYDSINTSAAAAFEDSADNYPCTLGNIWTRAAEQAGYETEADFAGANLTVDSLPDWGENASIRTVMGHVAAVAGCFVRVDREDGLQMVPLCGDEDETAIGLGQIVERSSREASFGPVNALTVRTVNAFGDNGEEEELSFDVVSDAESCALAVKDNPLFMTGSGRTAVLARNMLEQLSGLTYRACDFTWRGDPQLLPGTAVLVAERDGDGTACVVSRQTLTFDGGFSAECVCGVPESGEVSNRGACWVGRVSAGNLVGTLPSGCIAAQSVTASKLAAASVSADKIAAGAVTADKIASGAVTTAHLAAGAVTAQKIAAGSVQSSHIASGAVDADKIAARSVTADRLQTGTITANSGVIAAGAIGTAQIADGSVTSAKIVSLNADVIDAGTLSADRLLLTGEDGLIYEINAEAAGLTQTQLSEEEYREKLNGSVIVANSVTADQIAAHTITGNEILAGSITSESIDTAELFASQAVIDEINAMDIRGNDYLRLAVTEQVAQVAGGVNLLRREDYGETVDVPDGSACGYGFWRGTRSTEETVLGEIGGLNLEAGTPYTLGFDAWIVTEEDGAEQKIRVCVADTEDGEDFTVGADAARFTWTFTPEEDVEDGTLRFYTDENCADGDGYTLAYPLFLTDVKLEQGENASPWSPAPSDPAAKLKTSAIEIQEDHIHVATSGQLTVESGEFHVRSSDFDLSLVRDDGDEVVMDIDEDGYTTFKNVYAGNLRPAQYDTLQLSSGETGGMLGLAAILRRTDARYVVYSVEEDDYADLVTLEGFNGCLHIIAGSGGASRRRIPQLICDYSMSGNIIIEFATLSQRGYDDLPAVSVSAGQVHLYNCWFEAGTTMGILARRGALCTWWNGTAVTGVTLSTYFARAQWCGVVKYAGYIPGGAVGQVEGGFVDRSPYGATVVGGATSGSVGKTQRLLAGTRGYWGSSNGWHTGELYQGYTQAKGRIYGCVRFDMSFVTGEIASAQLVLHREDGVGLNRKATVTLYGTSLPWGSNPSGSLTDERIVKTELISWGETQVIDVTAAARALKSGQLTQLVFYTGETSATEGKVYSRQYARFDSVNLQVSYN